MTVFEKADHNVLDNYPPVNILPSLSKNFKIYMHI